MMAGKDWRVWKGLIIGAIPVVLGALIDIAMGLRPYEWIYTNYRINIVEGKMQEIAGLGHPMTYVALLFKLEDAFLVLPILVVAGWRRHRRWSRRRWSISRCTSSSITRNIDTSGCRSRSCS